MASEVGIVNYALSLLGDDPITDLADDNERARLANRVYEQVRDAVLRAHPWNFAVTRKALVVLAESPVFSWSYQYQLPTDPYCLRVLALNSDEEDREPSDVYAVEGHRLLTNEATANIRYVAKITDSEQFDALFSETVAFRLAATMAYARTGDNPRRLWEAYEDRLREARTVDGQEGSPVHYDITTLTDVR